MRAAIELPAVAIFTIVAGSLIVLFFVLLTQHQGSQAESDTQARSLQLLDTLIKSAATSKATTTNITIIDNALLFECDATGFWYGYSGGEQLPIFNTIIFSPEKLAGGQLKAETIASDIPFRALNVLYLETDANIIYYQDIVRGDLTGFPFDLTEWSGARDSTYRTVVKAGTVDLGLNIVGLETVTSEPYGTVHYFGGGSAVYPSQELMYGALLSKDNETYYCVFNAYLDQVKFVSEVLEKRAEALKADAFNSASACFSKYQTDAFITIANLPRAEKFTLTDAEHFQNAMTQLAFVNNDLLTGDNCAPIY